MPDRMTARMVLRLSVIGQDLVIQFGWRPARGPRGPRAARGPSVEAFERSTKIVEQGRKIPGQRRSAADQHIIMMRPHRHDVGPLHHLAEPAPDAVALGGSAVLLGDGKSDPDRA